MPLSCPLEFCIHLHKLNVIEQLALPCDVDASLNRILIQHEVPVEQPGNPMYGPVHPSNPSARSNRLYSVCALTLEGLRAIPRRDFQLIFLDEPPILNNGHAARQYRALLR